MPDRRDICETAGSTSATPALAAGFRLWTHGAREMAQNQNIAGSVTPIVMSPNMAANLGHRNVASSGSVGFPAMCRLMANDRPLM